MSASHPAEQQQTNPTKLSGLGPWEDREAAAGAAALTNDLSQVSCWRASRIQVLLRSIIRQWIDKVILDVIIINGCRQRTLDVAQILLSVDRLVLLTLQPVETNHERALALDGSVLFGELDFQVGLLEWLARAQSTPRPNAADLLGNRRCIRASSAFLLDCWNQERPKLGDLLIDFTAAVQLRLLFRPNFLSLVVDVMRNLMLHDHRGFQKLTVQLSSG